jgi:ArsR family metal-binding transcriptional regulator
MGGYSNKGNLGIFPSAYYTKRFSMLIFQIAPRVEGIIKSGKT